MQAGIPSGGAEIKFPLQDLVFGQKVVAGTVVGGRADMSSMLDFAAAKKVAPLVEEMPLDKINEAVERLMSDKARYRIVLVS